MRLGVEVTTCTPSRTGVGYYTEHLVDALLATRAAGDEVVLFSNRTPAPELAARWSQHLRVGGPAVRALWMQTAVPGMLTDAGIDLAVFPNYAVPIASPCATMVVVHDLAILRTPEHFTLQKRLLMRPILRQSVAAASVIGTVSEASKSDIIDLLHIDPDRILLLPCAAHPSCRPMGAQAVAEMRARRGLTRPYVLTVGTLEPRKGLLTVLRAFDRLGPAAQNLDLVVVGGRGWQDRKLVRALEERAAAQRVKWLGYVSESDLVALYSGADLFVFASTLEGFGLPVLEAMACGAPVVASDVAALREIGGDVPRFFPPGDEAALARAIAELVRDPASTTNARVWGLARARRFSWERTAEALWARARRAPARVRIGSTLLLPAVRVAAAEGHGPAIARTNGVAPAKAAAVLPAPVHPAPPGLGALEWALLAAVVYADLFRSPLSVREAAIASFGVSFEGEAEVRRLAESPALSGVITLHPTGFLVLAGHEALVDAIPEREKQTQALLDRNQLGLSALARLPFVRALVISGGVAHRNPGSRPDVDLFVVAARGRAYTAYTMLFLATKLTGSRHLICPNYLVDESELAIVYHRDLFTAHQLVSSLPYSGQGTYEAFCLANEAWVRPFFPAFAPRDAQPSAPQPSKAQYVAELALRPAGRLAEESLRWAWRARLRRRAATAVRGDVILGDGILKLHLSDYRRTVLERFAARLEPLRARFGGAVDIDRTGLPPVGT